MVSVNKIGGKANERVMELSGLSTDVKPIGEVDGVKIVNGSEFIEMDTCNVFMYDEENQRWLEL